MSAARLAEAFAAARRERRAALMPYAMGGYPDLATSREVLDAYCEGGADCVELGVPFSDPLADGPVIHAAATTALEAGTKLEDVLELCAHASRRVPVVLMAYANMVLGYEPAELAGRLGEAGAAGLIVPDLPHEQAGPLREALDEGAMALVPLIAPTTPPERRARIGAHARGFVYLVSVSGVTGERELVSERLPTLVRDARDAAGVPVAVGFGISTPEQAGEVGRIADGVIVGSRLVREAADGDGPDGCERLCR